MKKLRSIKIAFLGVLLACSALPVQALIINYSYDVQAEYSSTPLPGAPIAGTPTSGTPFSINHTIYKDGEIPRILQATTTLYLTSTSAGEYDIQARTYTVASGGGGGPAPQADRAKAYLNFSFTPDVDFFYTLDTALGAGDAGTYGSKGVTTPLAASGILSAGTLYSFELFSGVVNFNENSNVRGSGLGLTLAAVPVPAAVWLMGSALVGLVGLRRRKV